MNKKSKELTMITTLIKYLQAHEKSNPQILFIPDEDFKSKEEVEGGSMMAVNRARCITGMQVVETSKGQNPTIIFTTKKLLSIMVDELKEGKTDDDLSLPLKDLYVNQEQVENLEKELR